MIDRQPPWIVGHRGVAAEALENSLVSLQLAVRQKADMIELDVQLTSDGELVVFHDWDLLRLAGRPEVVEGSERERLTRLFHEIRTLPEILAALPTEMPLNIELKRRRAEATAMAATLQRALEGGGARKIVISSFDWALLDTVRARMPERKIAPLLHEGEPAELLATAERLRAWSIHCHHSLAKRELIDAAERAGRPVLVYTVNSPDQARDLFDRGVAGVFTDAPGRLRAALGL